MKLEKDNSYAGGHYFGKFELPIGKGNYIKIGSSKIFGREVSIVRLTGKKKKIEYWECGKCFNKH